MKSLFRALSLLICLAMLTAAVPVELASAYASEAAEEQTASAAEAASEETSAPAEVPSGSGDADGPEASSGDQTSSGTSADVPPADGGAEPADPTDAPSTEPSDKPLDEASAEPSVEASAEPSIEPSSVPTGEPSAEPTLEPAPAIDYAKRASYSPEFVKGFAEVLENDTAVYEGNSSSDEAVAWIGKGVVYVIGRTPVDSSKPDRLQVAFNVDPESDIETGWIDANAARPMNPEEGGELEAYIDGCMGDERVRCYGNDEAYPLRVIDCRYPAAPEGTPEPVTVSISQTSATIGVGDTGVTLGVAFSDGQTLNADGTARAVKFSSSATKYVTVNASTGALKGVRKGSATITATTEYGSVSCKVTVKSAPKTIKATPASAEILIDETTKISPKFASSGYGGSCSYQSSDPAIATVDASGNVTGVSKGLATIYVYAYNLPQKPAKATVAVYGPATAIDLSEDMVTLCSGMESQLSAILPEYEREAVVFSSSNSQVASVTENGLVYAHGEGSATITATTANGLTDSCEVQVLRSPAEENVVLSANSYKLGLKEKFNVLNLIEVTGGCHAAFTFKSSNTKYAKVDAEGYVTGMRAGSATISITTHNGIVRKVKVTVYKNPKSVSFSPKSITLGVGMSVATKVKFNSSSVYSQHKFESSDPSVAKVDPATGVVTAVGTGTAVIGCIPLKGKSGACAVTVVPAPSEISASADAMEIGMGETGRSVTGQYPEGTLCSFTYKSQDESVVAVDATTGEITTVNPGSTDIIVTAHNGATAICRVNVLKAPTKLTLNKSTMKLMVGETNDTLTGTVDEGAASGLTFTSSNSRYVKVSGGKLVGVKAGTVTITAKTYNNKKDTCKVRVYAKPTSVAFSSKTLSLGVGDSAEVTVKFNSTKAYSPCSFESSNESVATIDPNTGVIAAHREGTATLTVTTLNGKTGTCEVNVLPAPENISAAPGEINVGLGETGRSVTGQHPEGTLCSFTYKSQDESVVAVNATTGELTTVKTGSADIIVTAHNGATAVCRVNVMQAPAKLTLNKTTMKLMVGEINDTLTGTVDEGAASGVTFTSSNSRYVKVSGGKLVGVKAGTVTITAKTYNNKKATCKVTVYAAPKSVSFKTKSLTIGCGESVATAVTFNPTKSYSVCTASSSDEAIATVDPTTGVVTGVAPGTAIITATPQKGASDTCTVVVCPAPTSVTLPQSTYALSQGMSLKLVPELSAGAAGKCSFISSDPDVVAVDADGMIKGLSGGSATITATTYNGISTSCAVTVTPAPANVKYDFTKITMLKGDQIQIPVPTAYDVDGNPCPSSFTFKSSNARYASISGGSVKGLKTGTVTITATSYNGKKASFKLKIASTISGLALVPEEKTLYTNGADYVETLQLSVGTGSGAIATVTYVSSDPNIASVTPEGLVTPVNPGTTTISAQVGGTSVGTATITVLRLSSSIGLDAMMEMGEGESFQLRPRLDEGASAIITYETSNANVASVDQNGLIKAGTIGEAVVTARMQDGQYAQMTVRVLHGPTGIRLNLASVSLAVGERVVLTPQLIANEEDYCDRVSFTSSDEGIVSIGEDGSILALANGEATVTARTCNGLTASCRVLVSDSAEVAFEKDNFGIICGDRGKLPVQLNKAAIERGYSLTSSDETVLKIDGTNIVADPLRPGVVTVTLTVNPEEGAEDAEPMRASCTVNVCDFVQIDLPEEVSLPTNSELTLEYALMPENLIGTYSFAPEDESLISFDPETGIITSKGLTGTTNLVFKSFNDSFSCAVTVVSGAKYRALVVGSYNNSGSSNDLPFVINNVNNVCSALSRAKFGQESYDITSAAGNPSKSSLKSLITGTFREATDEDVSVIYIVTHGYYQATTNGYYGYYFSLAPSYSKADPSTYVTARELMSWISGIQGNVILVLDSCHSGGFIVDCSGLISSMGRLSVLTAQTYDQNASFYQGTSKATTVEFLTYAFCRGLGYDQMSGALPALNADSNGDGLVTVTEAFAYAKADCEYQIGQKRGTFKATDSFSKWMAATSCIKVPGAYKREDFNAWYQSPQYRVAANGSELAICAR